MRQKALELTAAGTAPDFHRIPFSRQEEIPELGAQQR
jgi:hypothetical protein